MKKYRSRVIDSIIRKKLQSIGGLVLQGSRAVGKTTTAQFHSNSSIRLDESQEIIERASIAPNSILKGETPRLIDEWQIVPSIWNAIRHELDDRGKQGQFILAGSAAPNDDITRHTGAGRFSRLTIRPMTLYESGDSTEQVDFKALFDKTIEIDGYGGPTIEEYAGIIVRGGWPLLINLTPQIASDAMIDYVENLTKVDLRTLKSPPDPIRVNALLKSIARNISTEASLKVLAQDAEISDGSITDETVRKYLDQLSQVYVLEELPAWKTHIRSSIQMRVKPKWHFVDPSIGSAALRVSSDMLLNDLNTLGLFFESMVLRDIRVFADVLDAEVYHYRDSTNLEVDMIVERKNGEWAAIEVKLGGENAIIDATDSLTKLKNRLTKSKLSQMTSLNIITAGINSYRRPDGINIISLGHLFLDN